MKSCPKFSRQREHFEDWVEEWERLLQVVTGIKNGRTLHDRCVTESLLQKLEDDSAMEFLMRRKQYPELAVLLYEFSQNFAVDYKLVRRHKRRKEILQKTQRKIMMPEWR